MAEIPLPSRTDGPLGGHRNQRTFQVDQQAGAVYGKDPGVRVPQGAFGVDTGKAFDGIIEPIMEAHDKQVKLYDATKSTEALQAHERTINEEWQRRQLEDDPTRPGFQSEWRSYMDKATETLTSNLAENKVSPWAATEARLKANGFNESAAKAAGAHVIQANRAAAKVATDTITNKGAEQAYNSPDDAAKIEKQILEDHEPFNGQMAFQDELNRDLDAIKAVRKAAALGYLKRGQPEQARAILDGLPTSTVGGRSILRKPNGGYEVEGTKVVTDKRINNGRPTPIPTIYNGAKVSEAKAIEIIAANGGQDPDTSRELPGYATEGKAKDAAEERDAALREDIKNYKGRSPFTADEYATMSKQIEAYDIAKQGLMASDKAILDNPDDRAKQQAALAKIKDPHVRRQAEADLARAHGWMDQEQDKQDRAEVVELADSLSGAMDEGGLSPAGAVSQASRHWEESDGTTKPENVGKREKLIAEVKNRIATKEQLNTIENRGLKKGAWEALIKSSNFSDPDVQANLHLFDGTTISAMQKYARDRAAGIEPVTNRDAWRKFFTDPDGPEGYNKISLVDFHTKYINVLDDGDFKTGADMIKKRDSAETKLLENQLKQQNRALSYGNALRVSHGLTAKMKKGDPRIQQLDAAMAAYVDQYHEDNNGKYPDSRELNKFGAGQMLHGEAQGSGWFSDDKLFRVEVPARPDGDKFELRMKESDLPAIARATEIPFTEIKTVIERVQADGKYVTPERLEAKHFGFGPKDKPNTKEIARAIKVREGDVQAMINAVRRAKKPVNLYELRRVKRFMK